MIWNVFNGYSHARNVVKKPQPPLLLHLSESWFAREDITASHRQGRQLGSARKPRAQYDAYRQLYCSEIIPSIIISMAPTFPSKNCWRRPKAVGGTLQKQSMICRLFNFDEVTKTKRRRRNGTIEVQHKGGLISKTPSTGPFHRNLLQSTRTPTALPPQ